jgi:hypothetical protein
MFQKKEKNPINPIYGISLLEWLKEKSQDRLELAEPYAEDWGWCSEVEYEGRHYLLGACAHFEEGDDSTPEIEWVFQVNKYRNLKEKLLGKTKMSTSDGCVVLLREVFERHPNIKQVEVA